MRRMVFSSGPIEHPLLCCASNTKWGILTAFYQQMLIERFHTDSQLDRIMQAYRLPLDLRSVNPSGQYTRESISSTRVRQGKLHMLLEYLGAYRLLEHEKLKRGAVTGEWN